MNYFAHALPWLDRPYFVAGTALPDLLSVLDRRVRLRGKLVAPFANGSADPAAEVAAGVLQHLHDDDWFHRTPGFLQVTTELTQRFRGALPAEEGYAPSFLGHIVTEMLLDSVLIEQHPGRLEIYYALFRNLDCRLVQRTVNAMARNPTDRLTEFLPHFERERFLYDYQDAGLLLVRLNQVLQRVKLNTLPPQTISVLEQGRQLISEHVNALLPSDYWPRPASRPGVAE